MRIEIMRDERKLMETLVIQSVKKIDAGDLRDILAACAHAYGKKAAEKKRWLMGHYWMTSGMERRRAKDYLDAYRDWTGRYGTIIADENNKEDEKT